MNTQRVFRGRFVVFAFAMLTALCLHACDFGTLEPPVERPVTPDDPIIPMPPAERWHVLNNIEYAFQRRRPASYEEVLDENFTFHFSPRDVAAGQPETLTRAEDIAAVTAWFESHLAEVPVYPIARSMRLDLKYQPDALTWIEIRPDDQPGHVWYATTVSYELIVEVEPDVTYVTPVGAQVEFVVHNVGSKRNPTWKLLQLRDLAGADEANANSALARFARSAAAPQGSPESATLTRLRDRH
jgi:hypothetical protein